MVPLRTLQRKTTSNEETSNLETTTDSDRSFETFQLCQQQMGEIPESGELSI